jgi:hypothetical protein
LLKQNHEGENELANFDLEIGVEMEKERAVHEEQSKPAQSIGLSNPEISRYLILLNGRFHVPYFGERGLESREDSYGHYALLCKEFPMLPHYHWESLEKAFSDNFPASDRSVLVTTLEFLHERVERFKNPSVSQTLLGILQLESINSMDSCTLMGLFRDISFFKSFVGGIMERVLDPLLGRSSALRNRFTARSVHVFSLWWLLLPPQVTQYSHFNG